MLPRVGNFQKVMTGIYLLEIHVKQEQVIRIGARGPLTFTSGLYLYVGSAQQHLEHRLARHFRQEKRLRWHIDYLLTAPGVTLRRAWYADKPKSLECASAQHLTAAASPVPGFGSSDCRCISHLFFVTDSPLCDMKTFLTSHLPAVAWKPFTSVEV